jgi:hypothetical protein
LTSFWRPIQAVTGLSELGAECLVALIETLGLKHPEKETEWYAFGLDETLITVSVAASEGDAP